MDKEEDISELLDALVWGHRIIDIQIEDQDEQVFVLRPLTLEERNIGNYVYKHAFKDAVKKGILTRKQLTKDAIGLQLWKANYEQESVLLQKELTNLTSELTKLEEANKKRRTPTTVLKRLRKRFAYVQETLQTIEGIHTKHIELPSAEYKAECERGNYFLHCTTYTFPDNKKVWPTLEHLENDTNTILVAYLLHAYYRETIADESTIRHLARTGIWRCKWAGAKKNRGVRTLFDREMYDLTMDQFRLMYWSQVYDSAYAAMEPPSEAIVEDDKLFDRWLDEQHKKQKHEQKKSAFSKKVNHIIKDGDEIYMDVLGEYCEECICGIREHGPQRLNGLSDRHDPSCSYGVFIYYNEDKRMKKVEEVQSTNMDSVRKMLASEQKYLSAASEHGVEEQVLRGDKSRHVLGLSTTVHKAGDYGKK